MKVSAPLRTIAAFEAAKGMLVLLAGFGTLALIHFDAQRWAGYIVAHLHLNLAKHEPKIFIDLANQLNSSSDETQTGSVVAAPAYDPERNDIWYSDGLRGFYVVHLTADSGVTRFARTYVLPGS